MGGGKQELGVGKGEDYQTETIKKEKTPFMFTFPERYKRCIPRGWKEDATGSSNPALQLQHGRREA